MRPIQSAIGRFMTAASVVAFLILLGSSSPMPLSAQGGSSGPVYLPVVMSRATGSGSARHLGIWVGAGDSTTMVRLQNAGAKWTRVYLSWATIEPALTVPATYNFSSYDSELAAIAAAG